MDPISALIGGGASIIGGLMNTSSTQAINAANLQAAMWSAQGGYLPGLVKNAGKAGLNPLAVLGSRGPNMAVQVGEQPGAGLQAAGAIFSRAQLEGHELDMQAKKEEIQHQAAVTKQTNIDNAIRLKTLDDLIQGKTVSGPQPAQDTSLPAVAIQGAKDVTDWIGSQYNRLPSYIRRPQEAWDWRDYMPDFRHTPW